MCIEYLKFPNESVHTECIRYESVRVLTRPLRHRFVIVTGRTCFGKDGLLNEIPPFAKNRVERDQKHRQEICTVTSKYERQVATTTSARRARGVEKKGNVGWIARHTGSCPFSRINGSLDCQPCPSVTLCAPLYVHMSSPVVVYRNSRKFMFLFVFRYRGKK